MEERSGWLKRSLDQARVNIEARPEHLKPARYRTAKPTARKQRTSGRADGRAGSSR